MKEGRNYYSHCSKVIIISHYVLTECNKCLVYSGFYCFSLIAPGP